MNKVKKYSIFVIISLLFMLLVVGVGLKFHFSSILNQQLRAVLEPYGVEDFRVDGVHIGATRVRFDALTLTLDHGGVKADIELHGFKGSYRWSQLKEGRLKEIEIAQIAINLYELAYQEPETDQDSDAIVDLMEFLPNQLLKNLPLDRLQIARWDLVFHPSVFEASSLEQPLSFSGSSALTPLELMANAALVFDNGHIELELRSSDSEPVFLDLRLVGLEDGKLEIAQSQLNLTKENMSNDNARWDLSVELDVEKLLRCITPVESLSIHTGLCPGLTRILGESLLRELRKMKIQSRITLDMNIDLPYSLDMAQNVSQWIALFDGRGRLSAFVQGEPIPNLEIDNLEFTTEFQAKDSLIQLDVNIEEETQLQWRDSDLKKRQQWKFAKANGKFNGRYIEKGLVLDRGQGQFEQNVIKFTAPEVKGQIQLPRASVSFDGNTQVEAKEITFGLELPRSTSVKTNKFMPEVNGSAELMVQIRDEKIHFSLTGLFPETFTDFDVKGDYDLGQQSGVISSQLEAFQLDLSYQPLRELAKQYDPELLPEWVGDISFAEGSLSIKNYFSMSSSTENVASLTSVKLSNMVGLWSDMAFMGGDFTAEFQGVDEIISTQPMHFTLDQFKTGVDLDNVLFQGSLIPNKNTLGTELNGAGFVISIDRLRAELFGGEMFIDQAVEYDLSSTNNMLELTFSDLELSQIVALQEEAIEATGVMDGRIPIEILEDGFSVENGYLKSRDPGGTIRYPSDATVALAQSNPQLGLALRMLDNFKYKTLSSRIDFSVEGQLAMALMLNGNNPAEMDGRPVEFNINVDQNVYPLLKSIRITDDLVKDIEQRIQ